jgi:hypothetical protein
MCGADLSDIPEQDLSKGPDEKKGRKSEKNPGDKGEI